MPREAAFLGAKRGLVASTRRPLAFGRGGGRRRRSGEAGGRGRETAKRLYFGEEITQLLCAAVV